MVTWQLHCDISEVVYYNIQHCDSEKETWGLLIDWLEKPETYSSNSSFTIYSSACTFSDKLAIVSPVHKTLSE